MFGVYFAARGLPFVIVDVAGRGIPQEYSRPQIQEDRTGTTPWNGWRGTLL